MFEGKVITVGVLVFLSLFYAEAYAKTLVLPVRGAEEQADAYCRSTHCDGVVTSQTKEFANGNTFVLIKSNVAGATVIVFSPQIINSDQFFELMIKIRTLKSEFAGQIKLNLDPSNLQVAFTDGSRLNPSLTVDLLGASGLSVNSTAKPSPVETTAQTSAPEKTLVLDLQTNSPLTDAIAQNLGLKVATLGQLLQAQSHGLNLSNQQVIIVSSPTDPHNESVLKALEATRIVSDAGGNAVLVTPYLPYARSDKKDQKGVAVTGALIARLIESSGAKVVQFVRAHAPQSQGFFDIPSIQTMGRDSINAYLKEQGVEIVVSPDAGFQKDATLYADGLGVPVAVINKQRNLETGESKLHDISGPDVNGKVLAVIDDETASGGTGAKAAEFLKARGGKKVIFVVTHLAGNAAQALNSPYIDVMVATDTFAIPDDVANKDNFSTISVAKEISSDLTSYLQINPSCEFVYGDSK